MSPARLLPLIPITMVLAGCGAGVIAPATGARSAGQRAIEAQQRTQLSTVPPASTASPTATPVAVVPTPATPAPQPSSTAVLVVEQPETDGTYSVSVVDATGHSLATTRIASHDQWTVVAGHGGAYWMDGGRVKMLTPKGSLRDMGSVPAGAGELLVSPDGTSYAYDTSTAISKTATENRIVVQAIGGSSRVIADRSSDPSHPSPDAPQQWMYGLMSWTAQGILFRREVTGTCGCQAFDMQMLAGYTGIIDPNSDTVTDLTSDQSCPLTALGAGLAAGCFQANSAGGASSLRIVTAGHLRAQFAMSGKNVGGYGVFSADSATLAYETVPASAAGCGSLPFPTTLHILDVSSGAAHATQINGLHTTSWPSGGAIYGDVGSSSSSSVVAIDPATMALHHVVTGPAGTRFIGVV